MTRSILTCVFFSVVVACGGNDNNGDHCGDGVKSGSEQCDDGNVSNGDGCSSTCKVEGPSSCGNGTVEVATEECDDGNTADGDGCDHDCKNECGNGSLDGTEECDDGNHAGSDGCSAACKVEPGFTCTGEPSDCSAPTGTCADPFVVALTDNSGTLMGGGSGDTTTGMDQVPAALCDAFDDLSGGANDNLWKFTITDTRDVTINLDGATTAFDAEIRLLRVSCDVTSSVLESYPDSFVGVPISCGDRGLSGDGEMLAFSALPAGTYYIVIDGYDVSEVGPYSFTVTAAPTTCGNGHIEAIEGCDDTNTAATDGCASNCSVEAGYSCTNDPEPSVCVSACGNGQLDTGEECDDGATVDGDRCSSTCTLEYDTLEMEPNDTTPQALTATHHLVKGALPTTDDVDLYTFTLTSQATVEIETYDSMDPQVAYDGVGAILDIDCNTADTRVRVFDATGDVTMDDTAKWFDDDDGAGYCSYVGPADSEGDTTQGVLPAGTYTIKVSNYPGVTTTRYILDLKITSSSPAVEPIAGDLAMNEFMAADNMSDTNCDGATTGTNDEFIELVNVSNRVLDLTGVTIADSVVVRHTFAAAASGSLTLDPGKAVVVWAGGAPNCPGVTNWFTATTGQLGLNDGGDTITIKNPDGATLINYTFPAATVNKSFNLSPDVTGATYVLHAMVPGAVGDYSPGKHADGTAF